MCAGNGAGTGGNGLTGPAHTLSKTEGVARCQGLSAPCSWRKRSQTPVEATFLTWPDINVLSGSWMTAMNTAQISSSSNVAGSMKLHTSTPLTTDSVACIIYIPHGRRQSSSAIVAYIQRFGEVIDLRSSRVVK